MTIGEIIAKLSAYVPTATILDYEDEDFMVSDIVYDSEKDNLYVKFQEVK